MSAQTSEAAIPNGVGSRETTTHQGSGGAENSIAQQLAVSDTGAGLQQTRGVVPEEVPRRELQDDDLPRPSSFSGAVTTVVQGEPTQKAPTTLSLGGPRIWSSAARWLKEPRHQYMQELRERMMYSVEVLNSHGYMGWRFPDGLQSWEVS